MKAEIYLGLDKTTQVAYSTQLKVKGITFKTIYDKVCEHFGEETLEEANKGRKKQGLREIFLMLVFECFEMPVQGSSRFLTILGDMIGRDRTTVLYYYKNLFLTDAYNKNLNYFHRGDFHTNHFYNIKKAVMGEESITKMLYRELDRNYPKSKLETSLKENRLAILRSIKRGEDLEYLNDRFFDYTDIRWLKARMKNERPGLLRLMRYHERKIEEMLR